MKFQQYFFSNKTALGVAVENENFEIVKFLLANENLNVNIANILTFKKFNKILIKKFNTIFFRLFNENAIEKYII